jgi:ATP-dependent DNA helicase RecG
MRFLKKGICVKTEVKLKKDYTDEFYFSLPFFPTNAQKKAILECIKDIMSSAERCMNRLLQGDVGSGKTVVAGALAYNIIKNGYQAAIMVPTEILANQHCETFKKIFSGMHINIELLTGSLKSKAHKEIRESIKEGKIDLLVGTHSLISESVEFKNLGLVVTDEQHRFGVGQRARLVSKGNNPHVLVMSATPIPRSLSLIIYGDMDISILDERPPNRQPVDTFVIDSAKKERMYGFIKKVLENKNQGYVVCPCAKESEAENLLDVKNYKEELLKNHGFSKYSLEILHGKMKSQEKEKIMKDFLSGKIDLLICTTVIEVGVDAANACIIIIENAERFGLSQLHQLRGRVGRGKGKSYCILVSDSKSKDSISRFKVMATSNDGFYLSNEDLKIRGPGEFLGSRQHGNINFKLVNIIEDISTIKKISRVADQTFRNWDSISLGERSIIEKSVKNFFKSSNQENIII